MFDSLLDLKSFVTIFESKNLSDAAGILRMTPGMVSKRLSKIEEEFGVRLFQRTTRTLASTEDGRKLYEQALAILEMTHNFEAEWGKRSEPSGLLTVTASASFARIYLMKVAALFLEKYPKIELKLELTDRTVDIVSEKIDLAIRIGELKDSSLIAKKLADGPRVLCASKKYLKNAPPLKSPADLMNHSCIVLNERYDWEFLYRGKEIVQRISPRFQCNLGDGMVEMIKNGVGVGVTARWHVAKALKSGELVELLPDYKIVKSSSVYAVYPSRRHLSRRTQCFIDFLEEHLAIDN
jgi:DNA-binding transcriptional LysR family regulator